MVPPAPAPVSIILPAYVPDAELHALTLSCLDSLAETTRDYELVVVDNGSRDLASQFLRDRAFTYVHKPQPIGYARAANIGLAIAEHDWLCVVNTDIEFTQDGWLDRLQADYLETPGGVLSAVDEDREPGIVFDDSWFSCWLTHRSVIQRVGYFDESMGYRFHDQDYAIRVDKAGYRVMRDGNVRVNHIDSATYDAMGRDDSEEQARLVEKWGADCFAQYLYNEGRLAPA